MFGDIGHGLALLLFGLFLIKNNETMGKGSMAAIFKLRYTFSLMGFFAFFCGLIYNDFFSIPWNLFGSCYYRQKDKII
jgi:V-type H+-transporting ATPase subunit a